MPGNSDNYTTTGAIVSSTVVNSLLFYVSVLLTWTAQNIAQNILVLNFAK